MVKKLLIVLGVAAVFMAANVFAAGTETEKPKKPEHPAMTVGVEGTVSVTKDANSVVTAIKLTTAGKIVYNITLDEKGKELGALDGKEVKAKGIVTEKDGQKWVKVVEYRLAEKKKETTPAAEPKPKSNK